MKKNILKLTSILGFSAITAFSLTSCGETDTNKVTIGVCGSSNDYWKAVQYELNQEGLDIDIDLVTFSAYNIPNNSLNAGEIDLNAFQHKAYLNSEVEANGYEIEAIGDTVIAPLTLYSEKYSTLDELKEAAGTYSENATKLKIAIPNDGTNQSRGIKLLEQAGLITVDEEAGYSPDLSSITGYLYNIEIVAQAANTLTTVLGDYAAATINGTYAIPYGLVPSENGLIIESNNSASDSENPYVNVIVSRTADKDNETYLNIVKAFQTSTVANYILNKYNEAYFPAFDYETITGDELDTLISTIDAIEL